MKVVVATFAIRWKNGESCATDLATLQADGESSYHTPFLLAIYWNAVVSSISCVVSVNGTPCVSAKKKTEEKQRDEPTAFVSMGRR